MYDSFPLVSTVKRQALITKIHSIKQMPVLQKNPIPNRDVLNRVKRYHQYVLTIPADISRQARLSEGQTVFAHAIKRDSRIALETAHPTNTHAVETSIRHQENQDIQRHAVLCDTDNSPHEYCTSAASQERPTNELSDVQQHYHNIPVAHVKLKTPSKDIIRKSMNLS